MANDIYSEFIGTVGQGISNPYALAAVAATGKHESGYSPGNAFGAWSDPSKSGQAGTAGGILSWRAERLDNLRRFAGANGDDPNRPSPATQAKFFLAEDPALIERLNNAGSVQEAQGLMNNAWRFAGYDRPGGEAARRLATANAIFGGETVNDGSGGRYTRPLNTGAAQMAGYPSNAVGGLAGLGGYQEPQPEDPGFFQSDEFGNVLQAVGLSLMSAPSNAPLSRVGDFLPGIQQQAMKQNMLEQEQAKENRTLSYLRHNFPAIAAQVDAGLPVAEAFRMASDERRRAAEGPTLTSDERNYLRAQSDPDYAEFIRGSGGGRYGLTPVYGLDENGNTVIGQLGSDGTFIATPMPEGIQPLSPGELNQQRSRGTEVGKGQGQAITSAPNQITSADQSLALIDDILADPNLANVTGWQGQLPTFQSQNIDVEAKVDQLKGRAFAEAIQQMVGLGALSDAEGKAILQGAARLDYRQSDAGFEKSLGDLRASIQKARERAAAIMSSGAPGRGGAGAGRPQPGGGANRTSNGLSWSVN